MSQDDSARKAQIRALLARPSSSGRVRFLVSLAAGLVVGAVVFSSAPRYGVLAGLMATAAIYPPWSYFALRTFDGRETKIHARREDAGSALTDIGGLVIILADVGAVVTILVLGKSKGQNIDAVLAVGGVLLSWFLLHSLYVSRYARLYYADPSPEGVAGRAPDNEMKQTYQAPQPSHQEGGAADQPEHVVPVGGGIDFNQPGYWPSYGDFTYFAFNLGMTFQVSDTSVSDPKIRRLVLQHCLLSYFFSTAITASVINLVVGLVS